MNAAPVALASARLARASQRILTPNGTVIAARSSPITAAIAAGISGPTASWYGRSASLQNSTPSTPASWSAARSRPTTSSRWARPRDPVVLGPAGQPWEMQHGDDRLDRAERVSERERHLITPSTR